MKKTNAENDDVDIIEDGDEDVTEEEENDDDETEDEEEETYIQSLVQEVVDSHDDIVNAYVVNPELPDELSRNESTKKFLVQKVRKRLLDSFESQQQWSEDDNLRAMVKKCKREMAKNEELSAITVMKRIIKNDETIGELIEEAIEEQVEADDDNDEDVDSVAE